MIIPLSLDTWLLMVLDGKSPANGLCWSSMHGLLLIYFHSHLQFTWSSVSVLVWGFMSFKYTAKYILSFHF